MVESVITRPKWTVAGTAGCCGIGTVFRLAARDCTLSQRQSAQKAWYEMTSPKAIGSDQANWTKRTIQQILTSSAVRPRERNRVNYRALQTGPTWHGAAVPAKWAFAAVIEAMDKHRNAIYLLSDNMGELGDVHTGSFSTKNFARWLQINEAGQFQATGPIESLRTRRMIQGWLFTPNWKIMERLFKTGRCELIAYYKELNNDKRIKQPEQERLHARASDTAALVEGFTSSDEWGGQNR